ncbi:MAG: ATP-binding protein [Clostridium sp.]|nr:ATP-binding protein [Clostridium sp.]MCM1171771.1 ATP-binding protein [Clostridium sp.]MCM1207969.1 ATP-binding protein [Ruminococcus sp.]
MDIKELQNMLTMHLYMSDSLSCGVFAYTLPEREILIFNTEAKRLFHYDDAEGKTIGEVMQETIVPEDSKKVYEITSGLKKPGDSCEYKYHILRDDALITVECQTKLLDFDDGKRFILSVMQDVTEKENMEYMLKVERKQYREAVISNSLFDFSFDVTDGMLYHDVRYSNGKTFSGVYNVTFPTSYDALIQAWKKVKKPELLTPDLQNQNTALELIRQFENGNTHIACEYYITETDRYYRRVTLLSRNDLNGHVMAIVFANDITEVIRESSIKRNELAMINRSLTKQMEITKSFSSLYFASWEINLESREIFEISVPDWAHLVRERSGGKYREAADVILNEYVTIEYRHAMRAFLDINTLQQRINNENVLTYEYLSTINGWCSATFIPSQKDKSGNVTNVIYAVRSVDTEKRKELNATKALHDAYEAANRANNAKTDFLASMSHDIRTPMNAIIGMTNIAKKHLEDKTRVEDCLNKITVASNHLLGLINEVLDMNKIESGKLELVAENINLSSLIDNIVTMSKQQIEDKHHSFTLTMNNVEHENVIGDSMRIQQVFMNLLGNAVKYTPDGGELKLIASEKPTNNHRVGCFEFIFEDNGIGMSEEFLEKLYVPFSRAKDSRVEKVQGTGLGMSIAKNIVSMMNGDIKVESKLGVGTKFTVTIFLKLQNNGKKAAEKSDNHVSDVSQTFEGLQKKDFKGKRALLVEDNELNAEIAKEIIGMTGIEIEHVSNGKLAVEKLKQVEDGYYDIIFMDVQMPVMNGYEATRTIRAMAGDYAKNVPIIAMTANAFAEDVREAKEAGMNEHVAKPLDLKQLLTTLGKWVG